MSLNKGFIYDIGKEPEDLSNPLGECVLQVQNWDEVSEKLERLEIAIKNVDWREVAIVFAILKDPEFKHVLGHISLITEFIPRFREMGIL